MLKTQKVFWWRTGFAITEGKLGKEPDGEMGSVETIMKNSVELAIDLKAKDYLGITAFHHSCVFGKVKIAEIFIKNSQDLNIHLHSRCKTGTTSFNFACLHGQTKIAKILVKNSEKIKMDLNAKNKFEESPFIMPVQPIFSILLK